MKRKLRIAVLASTKATDMQAIIDKINSGELNAEIVCLISNKSNAYALERARKYGIEAIFIDPKGKTPEEYDTTILNELKKRNVDLVLLIGYNRYITKPLIDEYRYKIMNIHPSLLPAFPGWDKDVHRAVLEYGCKITGCTLHFVDEKLDAGPIILQKAVEVMEDDSIDSLKERVQKAEQEIILEGIKLFMEGRLKVEGNRVRILKNGPAGI
ncbi:MAG TPA: phosphoribosylglycinamide formyltransferase [Geobacterales bacterium]|nr:phosphoribosylglycinamide formyltransferase [Geobacterales bacterium]